MIKEGFDWRNVVVVFLLALVCLVPFNYMPDAVVRVGGNSLPIGWLVFFPMGAALLLIAGVDFCREKRIPGIVPWTVAFTGSLLVSSFVAEQKHIAFSTTAGFALRCVGLAWTGYFIGRDEEGRVRFIRWVALLGMVVAVAALFEVATGKYAFFQRTITLDRQPWELWTPDLGVAVGAIGQPLPLSATLNLLLPFSVWQWSRSRKVLWLVPVVAILVGIVMTFRRTAYLFAGLVLFVTVLRTQKRRGRFALVALFLALAPLASSQVRLRVSERFDPRATMEEILHGHRTRLYKTTWDMLQQKPLLGIGTRQYEIESARYASHRYAANTQDSQYLRAAAENGAVGLIILLGFAIYLVWKLVSSRTPDALPFFLACAVFLLVLNFLDGLYWPGPAMTFMAIAGVGCGAADGARRKASESVPS